MLSIRPGALGQYQPPVGDGRERARRVALRAHGGQEPQWRDLAWVVDFTRCDVQQQAVRRKLEGHLGGIPGGIENEVAFRSAAFRNVEAGSDVVGSSFAVQRELEVLRARVAAPDLVGRKLGREVERA